MQVVRQLLWDRWNVEHIALHDVTPDEVEEICRQDPITSETYNGRFRAIGRTRGKILTVILAPQAEEGGLLRCHGENREQERAPALP